MRQTLVLVAGLGLCALCKSSSALDVPDANYVVEPYATYSQPGLEGAKHMAFDGSGNLYVTHTYSSNMWRIRPNGEASEFLTGFQPAGVEWGGGTLLGDYLYVVKCSPGDGGLYRVDSNGQKTTVASWHSPRHGAAALRLDRVGNYGGHLFVATSSQDRICKLPLSGQISDFSLFPGWYDGGGPGDVVFDRDGGLYEGLMYASVAYNGKNRHRGGVFTLDAGGKATRFAKEIVAASRMRFDPTGDFYGELFVTGITDYDQEKARLYRLAPDGAVKEFARANGLLTSIVFGPDGALYVAEYDKGDRTTVISRVVRKPAADGATKPGSSQWPDPWSGVWRYKKDPKATLKIEKIAPLTFTLQFVGTHGSWQGTAVSRKGRLLGAFTYTAPDKVREANERGYIDFELRDDGRMFYRSMNLDESERSIGYYYRKPPGPPMPKMPGAWTIERDRKLDGKIGESPRQHKLMIEEHSDSGDRFVGRYLGIANDSRFVGQLFSKRSAVIVALRQSDDDYEGAYAGTLVAPDTFVGTWYDVGGNAGDFRLRRAVVAHDAMQRDQFRIPRYNIVGSP